MARILLAEDEEVLRMLVVDTLEDEGHTIDEAIDGVEATELIKKHSYDLVILDYMMPGLTGIEVIKNIRHENRETKIIMLSAKNQAAEQKKVLDAGANAFISKPFSPMELARRIEEIQSEAT